MTAPCRQETNRAAGRPCMDGACARCGAPDGYACLGGGARDGLQRPERAPLPAGARDGLRRGRVFK